MNQQLQAEFKNLLKETGVSKDLHKYLDKIAYLKTDRINSYIQEAEPLFALSRLINLDSNSQEEKANLTEAHKKWMVNLISKDWQFNGEDWYSCIELLKEAYGKKLLLEAVMLHIDKGLWNFKKGKANLSGKSTSGKKNTYYDDFLSEIEERLQCLQDERRDSVKELADEKKNVLRPAVRVLKTVARKEESLNEDSKKAFETFYDSEEQANSSDSDKVLANRNKTTEELCKSFKEHSEAMINCMSQMIKQSNEFVSQGTYNSLKKELEESKKAEETTQRKLDVEKARTQKLEQDYKEAQDRYLEKAKTVTEQKKQLDVLNKNNKELSSDLEEYKKANALLKDDIQEQTAKMEYKSIPMSALKDVDMLGPTARKNLIPILKKYGMEVDTNK